MNSAEAIQTPPQEKKLYRKLGFNHLETAEIVHNLNLLLANLHVHYQKLRNFHWNVEGPDFFDLHEQFELEYNAVKEQIDMVAERIRTLGKRPLSTLGEYLENAEILEIKGEISAEEMVTEVLKDFEYLLSFMVDVIDSAKAHGDITTDDMVTKFARRLEKRNWMLTSFARK